MQQSAQSLRLFLMGHLGTKIMSCQCCDDIHDSWLEALALIRKTKIILNKMLKFIDEDKRFIHDDAAHGLAIEIQDIIKEMEDN